MNYWEFIKNLYWKNHFLNEKQKEQIFYNIKAFVRGKKIELITWLRISHLNI